MTIVIEDRNMDQDSLEGIHEVLKGSPDYLHNNIILNVEDGLYLYFDFENPIDHDEMIRCFHTIVMDDPRLSKD